MIMAGPVSSSPHAPGWFEVFFGIIVCMMAWTLVGMLTVFYLVYAEIVRLHTICIWCTSLHAIILVMLLISVTQLQTPGYDEEEFDEEEEESPMAKAARN